MNKPTQQYGYMFVARDDIKQGDEHFVPFENKWGICTAFEANKKCTHKQRRRLIPAGEGYRILGVDEQCYKHNIQITFDGKEWSKADNMVLGMSTVGSLINRADKAGYRSILAIRIPVKGQINKDSFPESDLKSELAVLKQCDYLLEGVQGWTRGASRVKPIRDLIYKRIKELEQPTKESEVMPMLPLPKENDKGINDLTRPEHSIREQIGADLIHDIKWIIGCDYSKGELAKRIEIAINERLSTIPYMYWEDVKESPPDDETICKIANADTLNGRFTGVKWCDIRMRTLSPQPSHYLRLVNIPPVPEKEKEEWEIALNNYRSKKYPHLKADAFLGECSKEMAKAIFLAGQQSVKGKGK